MATKATNTVKTDKKKESGGKKKEPFFSRIGRYFKEVIGELKKLTWPTRKELVSYTVTVMGFILLLAVIIYVLDLVFGGGLGLLATIGGKASPTPTPIP